MSNKDATDPRTDGAVLGGAREPVGLRHGRDRVSNSDTTSVHRSRDRVYRTNNMDVIVCLTQTRLSNTDTTSVHRSRSLSSGQYTRTNTDVIVCLTRTRLIPAQMARCWGERGNLLAQLGDNVASAPPPPPNSEP